MKLIAEKRSRTDKYDQLRFVRDDGSATESLMPRQGILPHDLVHYVVESALTIRYGFTSLVARGADTRMVMEEASDPANADVEVEATQIEAAVEALQSQLWAGAFDLAAFLDGAAAACSVRGKPAYDFGAIDVEAALYERALELNRQWIAVPFFGTLTLEFTPQLL